MTLARDLADSAQKANFLDNVTSDVNTSLTDNAAAAANAVLPAGLILPFGNSSAPTGFLTCEGQEVLQSAYPALYAAIGTAWGTASSAATHFKLPDLRGAFLRGTGSHGSQNMANGSDFAGQAVGSFENDQFQGHRTNFTATSNEAINGGAYVSHGDIQSGTLNVYPTIVTDGVNGTPRTGDETRPFNAGILYCIKT